MSRQVITFQEEKPSLSVKICRRCHRSIPWDMRYQNKRRYGGPVCQVCLSQLWRQRGYAFERIFVRKLEKIGFRSDRIPTSGSGNILLPDIICYDPKRKLRIGFEVKCIDASTHKRYTVSAWKMKGKKKAPSQLVKAILYLQRHSNPEDVRRAGVAIRFNLGERVKSPIIVRLIEVTKGFDVSKMRDMTIDISDPSDMPELTDSTLSRRSRHIRKVRKDKKMMGGGVQKLESV